jgi:hypothetical protein
VLLSFSTLWSMGSNGEEEGGNDDEGAGRDGCGADISKSWRVGSIDHCSTTGNEDRTCSSSVTVDSSVKMVLCTVVC